ncbi:hypothetical protein [Coxiella burnetii]|nr:hypothetical protein [Coxiella burnetii]ACJ17587.1 hypothetical protein CbuG_0137 [Coxiella burnetii CbuG_Q212]ATN66053.1 hypothetical protein AYM17_00640 [Coxiella burnetii]OYK87047.1 hypothetical protein CbuQ229_00695 [Coxiella burnetii]
MVNKLEDLESGFSGRRAIGGHKYYRDFRPRFFSVQLVTLRD